MFIFVRDLAIDLNCKVNHSQDSTKHYQKQPHDVACQCSVTEHKHHHSVCFWGVKMETKWTNLLFYLIQIPCGDFPMRRTS